MCELDYMYRKWYINDQQESIASMLHDHQMDPDKNINISAKGSFSTEISKFHKRLN